MQTFTQNLKSSPRGETQTWSIYNKFFVYSSESLVVYNLTWIGTLKNLHIGLLVDRCVPTHIVHQHVVGSFGSKRWLIWCSLFIAQCLHIGLCLFWICSDIIGRPSWIWIFPTSRPASWNGSAHWPLQRPGLPKLYMIYAALFNDSVKDLKMCLYQFSMKTF